VAGEKKVPKKTSVTKKSTEAKKVEKKTDKTTIATTEKVEVLQLSRRLLPSLRLKKLSRSLVATTKILNRRS